MKIERMADKKYDSYMQMYKMKEVEKWRIKEKKRKKH